MKAGHSVIIWEPRPREWVRPWCGAQVGDHNPGWSKLDQTPPTIDTPHPYYYRRFVGSQPRFRHRVNSNLINIHIAKAGRIAGRRQQPLEDTESAVGLGLEVASRICWGANASGTHGSAETCEAEGQGTIESRGGGSHWVDLSMHK